MNFYILSPLTNPFFMSYILSWVMESISIVDFSILFKVKIEYWEVDVFVD